MCTRVNLVGLVPLQYANGSIVTAVWEWYIANVTADVYSCACGNKSVGVVYC